MVNILGFATIEIRPDMSPLKKAGAAFAAAGAVAGAAIVAGVNEAMNQGDIKSSLQAQLGTSNKVAADQGKIAGKLYSSGVSDSFQGAADAIKAVVQSGLAPPDATNAQLQKIATKASDVAGVFGQDLGGVTNAVSQLMRTGLAKNSTEAFDLITKGFQSGANKADDFLDTINEYSVQFKSLGITGPQALGLINQGLKAGARDGDIVADAIKEFGIRGTEGSKAVAGAFKGLGLDAKSTGDAIAAGGAKGRDAFGKVLERLRELGPDSAKAKQIVSALFGGPGEDLGAALFALNVDKAGASVGKTAGAADKLGKTIRSGPSFEIKKFISTVKQAFIETLGNKVLPVIAKFAVWMNTNVAPPAAKIARIFASVLIPALTGLIKSIAAVVNWFKQMGTWLIPITIAVGGFTAVILASQIATLAATAAFSLYRGVILAWTAITRIATGVQIAWNVAMSANPIGIVIVAIVALVAAIVIAYKRSETFRNIIQGVWKALKTGFKAVIDAAKFAFNWIKDNWVLLASLIGGPIVAAVIQIVKNWGRIREFFSDVMKAIKRSTIDPIIKFFSQTIPDASRRLRDRVTGAVGAMRDRLVSIKDSISRNVISPIKRFFTKTLPEAARGARDKVVGAIRWLALKVLDAFGKIISGAVKLFGWVPGVGGKLKKAKKAFDTFKEDVNRALGGIKNKSVSAKVDFITFKGKVISPLSAGRLASGGRINGPGTTTSDSVPIWASRDEHMLSAKEVAGLGGHKAVESLRAAARGYATGGQIGINRPGRPRYNAIFDLAHRSLTSTVQRDAKSIYNAVYDSLVPSFPLTVGGGVARWSGVVQTALKLLGQPLAYVGLTLRRMNQESGGNPRIVNKWDSNWQRGTPSVGLMQVIGPTFRSYAGRYRNTGPFLYGTSINPLANIYASMRYALAAYGSLPRAYNRAGGYDLGGIARGVGLIPKLTSAPERVLSPRQTAIFERMLTGRGAAPAASSGTATVIEKVIIENRGVIGSKLELENWLVASLDTLRKKGRIR